MTTDTAIIDVEGVDVEAIAADTESDQQPKKSSRGGFGVRHRIQRLSRMSRRSAVVTLVVLGLLVGAGTAATAVFGRSAADHNAAVTATKAARDSAQSRVPKVLSYDFNTVDSEFPGATQNLTGAFRDDFAKLGTSVIIPAAHRDSIVTKATVVGTSVVSADRDKVVLLLFLNQSTTSTKYQGPRLDGSRVRVTMANAAGTWLISDITPV